MKALSNGGIQKGNKDFHSIDHDFENDFITKFTKTGQSKIVYFSRLPILRIKTIFVLQNEG